MNHTTFTARWIIPVDRAPLARGTLTIDGDSIVAVEAAGVRTAAVDLGDVAILPGFVNAHTHLDLSDAAGRIPPSTDFTVWLRQVIAHRRAKTDEQIDQAIAHGIRESLRFGVTTLGDISAQGASWRPLVESPLRAVVYREAIGLGRESGAAAFEQIKRWLEGPLEEGGCQRGISPHAPYSVGRVLFDRLREVRSPTMPVAIHLGETRAELELLSRRGGAFVDFLRGMGIYDAGAFVDLAPWMSGPPATWIHANYLDPLDVARSRPRAVVYCPRTHAAFGHPEYPLRDLLNNSATVALATDSLASNPDLDVLAEARFVHKAFPEIPGDVVLRMITLNGAIALSDEIAARVGSLTPGKDATLVVLPSGESEVPLRRILESDEFPTRVMIRGQWVR